MSVLLAPCHFCAEGQATAQTGVQTFVEFEVKHSVKRTFCAAGRVVSCTQPTSLPEGVTAFEFTEGDRL